MNKLNSLRPLDLLPVILLLVLALTQQYLAHRMHLSPWLGGGYGMFSTYDGPGNRQVHVFAEFDGYRREVKIPEDLELFARKVGAFPAAFMMRRLATRIAHIEAIRELQPTALRVEIWRMYYIDSSLQRAPEPLTGWSLNLAAPDD